MNGEPGGNRTLNRHIKSGFEEARALEILISNATYQTTARDGTQASPPSWHTRGIARNSTRTTLSETILPLEKSARLRVAADARLHDDSSAQKYVQV